MPKPLRLTAVLLAALAVGAIAFWGAYRAARQAPPFYVAALTADAKQQKAAGQKFEQQSFSLHNAAHRTGRWSVQFTQEEINGWLAAELPAKFPTLLPQGLSQPRVAIETQQVQVAARYEQGGIETILSLVGDVQLTDEPNEIAVRIRRVRAGALPMPLGKLLDEISAQAAAAGIPLRWTEIGGDPVALVRVPQELDHRQLVLDTLELSDGAFIVAGSTGAGTQVAEPIQQAERDAADGLQR